MMSLRAMAAVWGSPRPLDTMTAIVLVRLADFADDHGGGIFPSVKRVAAECRLSPRKVQYILRDLEATGLLVKVADEDPGRRRGREYRLDLSALSQSPEGCTSCRGAGRAGVQVVRPKGARRAGVGVHVVHPEPPLDPPKNHQDLSGDLFGEQTPETAKVIALPAKAKTPAKPAKPSFPEQAFAEFWNAYPSPDEEKATRAAFRAALKRGATPAGLIDAARAYAEKVAREGRERQFITRAKNFLRNDAWKDATETAATPTAGNSKPRHQSIQDAAAMVFADTPEAEAFRKAL
ncbi:helix-turn-helix domain-containing protein [Azospirillum sp. B2RO_4]|uniref:helix-turn-helix domain-containing protein n=1 Tax=Azospirillum sp. B2RO_4 TaxID=3027796 RepID=UPI003DAA0F26